jgi:Ca2+-binding EF-hand superfamily protein
MIGIQKESKETAMLRHSFNQYDDDGSGFIDIDELQNLLKDLGHNYTEDELRRMTRLICDDEDAEGLNFEQFTSLTLRLPYWNKIGVKGTKHFTF